MGDGEEASELAEADTRSGECWRFNVASPIKPARRTGIERDVFFTMKEWIVSCDSCSYWPGFQNSSDAYLDVARHATENPGHNPKVTEEQR